MSSTNGSRSLPRACVIGAGSSGIAAVKALHERGIPFDCFEKSDEVGGNWVFGNRNGMSAAYRDLFIDVSRERMEYSDFPMPASYPDFPHHTHIARVLQRLRRPLRPARSDRLRDLGRPRRPRRGRVWEVLLDTGETRAYDALLIANGHHWDPRWPEPAFPGADTFAGEQLHAHSYVDNSIFAGKRVVVARHRQLRRGHRRGVLLRRCPHLPGRAPGRVDHSQVRVRPPGRSDSQRPARPLLDPPAHHPPDHPRLHRRPRALRPAQAGPQVR